LILITAVIGLGVGYWREAGRPMYVSSPFFDKVHMSRLLRSVPVASGRLMLNGGGGGGRSPTHAQNFYEYSLSAGDRDLIADGFIQSLRRSVFSELRKSECKIQGNGLSRSNRHVTGFSYDYQWENTRGMIHVQSHRCEGGELRVSIAQLEFVHRGI
jgi:hypothetical protein